MCVRERERERVRIYFHSEMKAHSFQVLGDIEIAQGIERDKEKKQKEVTEI